MKQVTLIVVAAVTALAVQPRLAHAQDKPVASVNGSPITEDFVRLGEIEWANQLSELPPESRRQAVLGLIIENELVAKAAISEKMLSAQQQIKLEKFAGMIALRSYYLEKKLDEQITDEAVKKFYDQQVSLLPPIEEVRARHILVDSFETAAEIRKMAASADFSALARQFSLDPVTRILGGDLGYFAKGWMLPEIEQAAFLLSIGAISQPTKTSLGWHVVRLEDRRGRPTPTFSEIKDHLKKEMRQRKAQEIIASLRSSANVEILESVGSKSPTNDLNISVLSSSPAAAVGSQWLHNGSLVKLKADGAKREFVYELPADDAAVQGVRPGTLLFTGKKDGIRYIGTAYVFTKDCKPKAYPVNGEISADEKQVTLKGKVPQLDANCRVRSEKEEERVFVFQMPAAGQ